MEKGLVVEASENKITVRLDTSKACKSCGGCSIKDGYAVLEGLENTVKAEKDDTVLIENKPKNALTAASIIYLLPVAFLIVGYFISLLVVNSLGLTEKMAVLGAAAFFALSFLVVNLIDKLLAKNSTFKPLVVKKL